jgi:hypothetical protein
MKALALLACAATMSIPSVALAQEAEEPAAAPAPPPAESAALSVPGASCQLADHEGFEEPDSRVAARIVCDEIARAGAPAGTHYRVTLGRLGSATLLSVAREGETPGSTADSRELRLQSIEEVTVAAPRIARSIVQGTLLTETEKADNLVGAETRPPASKPGKIHFALGLVGLLAPFEGWSTPAPGIDLDLHYEAGSQRIEVGASVRAGSSVGGALTRDTRTYLIGSVGGRWYTSDADVSPYFGGGLSWLYMSMYLPNPNNTVTVDADAGGLGAYVNAGVQILRTHHTHLALGVRLDVPFFALNGFARSGTYYYAPLSTELRLTF